MMGVSNAINIYIYAPIYMFIYHTINIKHYVTLPSAICQVSSNRANKALGPWCKDIVTHFWHCAEVAEGSEERFKVIVFKKPVFFTFSQ